MKTTHLLFGAAAAVILCFNAAAQEPAEQDTAKSKDPYQFTMEYEIPHTPVKDQARTSTCWCFATVSMLEAELLRTGKDTTDLSEMFVVRHTYPFKAENYVRLHGHARFGGGAYSHDVTDQMKRFGMVPESVYPGTEAGEDRHNHGEVHTVLTGMLDGVIKKRGGRLTPRWPEAFEAVLDVYFGTPPETFTYRGVKYTPESFRDDYMELDPDDYIEISSYTHHPFYTQFRLEVPDNWTYNDQVYNVPVDDFARIMDNALEEGYTFVWGGDVSSRFFRGSRHGYAVVPLEDWEDKTREEQKEKVTEPIEEKEPTQELRQKYFDNYTATDDHAMHIVGMARDQTGAPFYLTKNSWGTDSKFDGYLYMSRPHLLINGLAIMVNRDALPRDIQKKLGIK